MRDLNLWKFILKHLEAESGVVLLLVLESDGSSPGRQGFKMAVTGEEMCGSIGGGMMEFNFVEDARRKLSEGNDFSLLQKQIHKKNEKEFPSGMICSGEQTVFVRMMKTDDKPVIQSIIQSLANHESGVLEITDIHIRFFSKSDSDNIGFTSTESSFIYREMTGYRHFAHIIGGGHCSYALSKILHGLDFHISVYDDRKVINTFEKNDLAMIKKVVSSYSEIGDIIPEGDNIYVIVMTYGYKTDMEAVEALKGKQFKYLGVLGSKSKVTQMKREWLKAGMREEWINSLKAPIGLSINSRTPEEIAVSIAGEMIGVKNGRSAIGFEEMSK